MTDPSGSVDIVPRAGAEIATLSNVIVPPRAVSIMVTGVGEAPVSVTGGVMTATPDGGMLRDRISPGHRHGIQTYGDVGDVVGSLQQNIDQ
jgi:hypothetical protein